MNAVMLGVTGIFAIPLLKEFFPTPAAQTTIVKIGVGLELPHAPKHGPGGNMPSVALFDANGNRIGFQSGQGAGLDKEGRSATIRVVPIDKQNNRPPEYLSLSASGNDPICVAYIAVTTPNNDYWTWNSNFASQCGLPHERSNNMMEGTTMRPNCTWLSLDGKYPAGIGLHLPDFGAGTLDEATARSQQYTSNPGTLCKSKPRQHSYHNLTELHCIPVFDPIPDVSPYGGDGNFKQVINVDGTVACSPRPGEEVTLEQRLHLQKWTAPGMRAQSQPSYGVHIAKRSIPQEQAPEDSSTYKDHHVVTSDIDAHSARELCENPISVGPDFISTSEGLFCDMGTHQLWPVCEFSTTKACFDLKTKSVRARSNINK